MRTSLLSALLLASISGCSRFRHVTHEYVYVSARQVYLHDRVAAVSNRVALVTNGEALELMERGKRFVKVRTPKGEIGWLEDHAIIDDKLYAQFQELEKRHAQDPVEANGQLRDDLYLHVLPGRETAHFLLEPANAKVSLLARGTVERAQPGMAQPGLGQTQPKPKALSAAQTAAAKAGASPTAGAKAAAVVPAPVPVPVPIPVEDWWLVRDAAGHTGWLLANRVDVDVPDEVGQYAEGQRMIAAYPIAKVLDDGSGNAHEGRRGKKGEAGKKAASESPDGPAPVAREVTEFVTVLSPPRSGLPYDFDQVRVFTWSLNHHRYETGYRLHGFQGYLPVKIGSETVNGVPYPTFSFEIANGPDISIDPDNGITRPVNPRTISFRLEGNLVRRTGADMAPIVLTRDSVEAEKAKAAKRKR